MITRRPSRKIELERKERKEDQKENLMSNYDTN